MMEVLSREKLEQILEEVSTYEVALEEDPTQVHLGTRYVQRVTAQCRGFLNRVTYYIQLCKRQEKNLRRDLKEAELDLEFKMKEKLADDQLVRKQPSIEDRKALASSMLKDEYQRLGTMQVDLLDLDETIKILRMKHQDLQRTSGDIKLQCTLIRDDIRDQLGGGNGYMKPQTGRDKSVPNGMAPPVSAEPVDPRDLLDSSTRPAEIPEPKDAAHASMINDFLQRHHSAGSYEEPKRAEPPKPTDDIFADVGGDMSFDEPFEIPKHPGTRPGVRPPDAPFEMLPKNGMVCEACGEPQVLSNGGETCKNGHGGAGGLTPEEWEKMRQPKSEQAMVATLSYEDLLT